MSRYIRIILVFFVCLLICGCNRPKYTGAHIVAGEVSGDVQIRGWESVSFRDTRIYLKDGGELTLAKGMFILFTGDCPICRERREDGN